MSNTPPQAPAQNGARLNPLSGTEQRTSTPFSLGSGRLPRVEGRSTGPLAPTHAQTPSPTLVVNRLQSMYSRENRVRPSPRTYATNRFIPTRANVHSFRMGAPPALLSSEERLLRRSTATPLRERSLSPERRLLGGGSVNNISRNGTPSQTFRAGQVNRMISAGSIGVFGMGMGAQSPREAGSPVRQRGRQINGHIFQDKESPEVEAERYERRISAAMGIDRSRRVLTFRNEGDRPRDVPPRRGGVLGSPMSENESDRLWADVFGPESQNTTPQTSQGGRKNYTRKVPPTPFRVLDAPGLRDDYYCSLIAYSPTTHSLAVGLNSDVYSWTEVHGARPFETYGNGSVSHVTSLAFSSVQGGSNILAIGRIDGSLTLWNPSEGAPRLEQQHNAGIACLAWKPVLTYRQAGSGAGIRARSSHNRLPTEELLVGDELGNVFFYSVEWNAPGHNSLHTTITLLKRIVVHTQQICGLAWSADGEQFVTGGNDNVAFLFDTADVVGIREQVTVEPRTLEGGQKYRWPHGAAVKAIAFCPWQRSLLATGGGSNDRCIHFFHTFSGATLATINVSAQVTSLLWSTSHREIAATFGYANPDHPVRIAVFSWPECKQVVQVPWAEDMRALYAVSYPGGPTVSEGSVASSGGSIDDDDDEDELEALLLREVDGRRRQRAKRRPQGEGCIVVAASDETVRFHEVWSENRKGVLGWRGVLGGSDILEELEGIERDGAELIR